MTIDARSSLTNLAPLRNVSRALRDPLAIIAIVVIVLFLLLAIVQQWIRPFPVDYVNLALTNAPPFTSEFVLGGDKYGRDILSRLIAGSFGALLAGATLTSVAIVLGVSVGLLAGYYGGLVDNVGNWLFSILIAAPGIIILIALYTVVGASMPVALAVLGVLSAPSVFLLVRTLTMHVRSELFVDAARVFGISSVRIIGRHVLLAVRGPIIVLGAFLFASAMAVSAGLEFLGLGDRQEPSWGGMLSDAFTNFYIAPWQLIWPGAALGIVMAAFVLLGNAIRDSAASSTVKQSERGRRKRIRRLFGETAVSKTLGADTVATAVVGTAFVSTDTSPVLAVDRLQIAYAGASGVVPVVRSVSFTVGRGEVVGLVGESGSGKTQTVLAILGLLPEEAIIPDGSVRLDGVELIGLKESSIARLRGRRMAYIPQEPMSNLDPSSKIGTQLVDGIRSQSSMSRAEAKALALSMLARVGIRDPQRTFDSYSFQISGGMAQRVLIAGAVATRPALLIADEPTTALDVTVQAEVLDLLRDLKDEFQMSVLIVTHNFGVVADLCDRVVVMRDGEIVEIGETAAVFEHPQNAYTRLLLDSVLDDAPRRDQIRAARASGTSSPLTNDSTIDRT